MNNLPIAASNSKPSANAAGPAQKNGTPDAQPENQFGSVLAKQMNETGNSAANAPSPASDANTKTATDSTNSADKTEQDQASAATDTPGDPASALIAMLQLPQEIKAGIVKDAMADTTENARVTNTDKTMANQTAINAGAAQAGAGFDMTTAGSGKADTAITVANTATTAPREAGIGKAVANQPAVSAGATRAGAEFDAATAASGKTDAAIMAADAAATAREITGTTLRKGPNPEIVKSAELPNSLLNTAQSAQNIAQPIGPMIASAVLSGDKTASLQTISSPLGSGNWPDELSQKISWMSTQRNQVAELHLNPPNLGPLDVVLKISDNQATVLFTSPHGAVRDAVENALPRLREVLADNGIMLGNATVSDQSSRGHGAEWFTNQDSNMAAQREISNDLFKAPGLSPVAAQSAPVRRHDGLVDTFA